MSKNTESTSTEETVVWVSTFSYDDAVYPAVFSTLEAAMRDMRTDVATAVFVDHESELADAWTYVQVEAGTPDMNGLVATVAEFATVLGYEDPMPVEGAWTVHRTVIKGA